MFNPSRAKQRTDLVEGIGRRTHQLVQRAATVPSITLSSPSSASSHNFILNKPLRAYSFKPKRLRLAKLDFAMLCVFVVSNKVKAYLGARICVTKHNNSIINILMIA